MNRRFPSERVLNRELSGPAGEEVVQMDVLPVTEGQSITLTFEEVNAEWRQGGVLGDRGHARYQRRFKPDARPLE